MIFIPMKIWNCFFPAVLLTVSACTQSALGTVSPGAEAHFGDAVWMPGLCGSPETKPKYTPILRRKCDDISGGGSVTPIKWIWDEVNQWRYGEECGFSIDIKETGSAKCDILELEGSPVSRAWSIKNPSGRGSVIITAKVSDGGCPNCTPTGPYEAVATLDIQVEDEDEDDPTRPGGPSCGSCGGGGKEKFPGTGSIRNDSVNFSLNLGRCLPDRDAGYLQIFTNRPSAALATRAFLELPFNRPGVLVM
jgi:hypothetical protein